MKRLIIISTLLLLTSSSVGYSQRIDFFSHTTGEIGVNENAKTAVQEVPSSGKTLFIDGCLATNNSGGAIDLGCGALVRVANWTMGQLVNANTPDYIDDKTNCQESVGTSDCALYTLTPNDGHLICADSKFNAYGVTVGTAEAGTAATYVWSYYNGTTMATLTTIAVPTDFTAADHVQLFNAPLDWVKDTTDAVNDNTVTDLSDKFCIRSIATTASGTTAALGDVAWVMRMEKIARQVADQSWLDFSPQVPIKLDRGEGALCYFGGTATVANTCNIFWRAK